MKSFVILAAIVVVVSAYGGQIKVNSKCINGRILPAFEFMMGPCQMDNQCIIPCQATCNSAGFVLLSNARCSKYKTKSGSKGYKSKRSSYGQKTACQCCCSFLPLCDSGYAPRVVTTSCVNALQCRGACTPPTAPTCGTQPVCGTINVTPSLLCGWCIGTQGTKPAALNPRTAPCDTRSTGSVTFENNDLNVVITNPAGTDLSTNKATGYYALQNPIPLNGNSAQSLYSIVTDLGTDRYVTGFSYQLFMDRGGGNGQEFLVYEPQAYGDGIWHSNTGGPNQGYRFLGTLDQYLNENPSAMILFYGYSLGSGVPATSQKVISLRFQCRTYTFSLDAPTSTNTICPASAPVFSGQTFCVYQATFSGQTGTCACCC